MVAAAVLVLWVVGIEARLLVLQVLQHDDLVARAEKQHSSTVAAPAKRGEIFDRHGRLLAYSVDADTIYAVPTEISDPAKTAAALCEALDDCTRKSREELKERLSQQRSFVFVRRRATPIAGEACARARPRRHRIQEGEQALLSESRAGGESARLRRPRQRRPRRDRGDVRQDGARPRRQAAGANRCAAPCLQPSRAIADCAARRSS